MSTVIIVVCSLKSMCVPSFIVIGYCVSELHGRFIAGGSLLLLYKNCIVYQIVYMLYDQILRLLSHHQVLFLYTLWFLR